MPNGSTVTISNSRIPVMQALVACSLFGLLAHQSLIAFGLLPREYLLRGVIATAVLCIANSALGLIRKRIDKTA